MAKAVFQLEPLTCPSCIKKIETTLIKQQVLIQQRYYLIQVK